MIGNKIALGQIDSGLAGGTDSISDAPIVYPRSYQQLLLASARGHTFSQRVAPWLQLRPNISNLCCPRLSSRVPDCRWDRAPKAWRTLADLARGSGPTCLRESHESRGCLARRLL